MTNPDLEFNYRNRQPFERVRIASTLALSESFCPALTRSATNASSLEPLRCTHTLCDECFFSVEPLRCASYNLDFDLSAVKASADRNDLARLVPLVCNADGRTKGCTWTGILAHRQEHLQVCLYQNVACPHDRCSRHVLRRDLDQHTPSCEFRSSQEGCEWATQQLHSEEITAHEAKCGKRPRACAACRQMVPGDAMDPHMLQCEEMVVPCAEQSLKKILLKR
eukprot:Rmarinus@m.27477